MLDLIESFYMLSFVTEDLQSQMRDVNEAHESTVNKLSLSENEITKLKEDNRSLRMALRNRSQELDEENIRLRDQVRRILWRSGGGNHSESLYRELVFAATACHFGRLKSSVNK